MDFLKLSNKEIKYLLTINVLIVLSVNIYAHGIASMFNPLFLVVWVGTVIKWIIGYCILRGVWRFFKRISNRS